MRGSSFSMEQGPNADSEVQKQSQGSKKGKTFRKSSTISNLSSSTKRESKDVSSKTAMESGEAWALRKATDTCLQGLNEKTVVMLGLTGHGKSQFIKSIASIFQYGEGAAEIHVGDGNLSTTSSVKLHSMMITTVASQTLRECDVSQWRMKNMRKTLEHKEEMHMFGGSDKWCADYYLYEYKAQIYYGKKNRMKINMVDVPGGSDSHGHDDEHFFEIAKFLTHAGGVTAFVFTLMHGRVYDADFQQLFNYYWNWLSHAGVPFVVMHTGWDPFMPHYKEKTQKRKDKFNETFPNSAGAKHIFIDSLWYEPSDEDYEEDMHRLDQQRKALAVRAVNELIEELLLHDDIALHQLPFLKTPSMVAIDRKFKESAQTGICVLGETLRNVEPDLHETASTISEMLARRNEAELREEPLKARLKVLDTDELVQIAHKDAGACHLWGWKTTKMTTQYPIAKLEPVAYTTAHWNDVTYDGCVAAGLISSGHCPRFTWGCLIAYARSSLVHQVEIKKLKEELLPIQRELANASHDYEREGKRHQHLHELSEQTHKELQQLSLVMRICTMPSMSVDAFVKLFPIYQSAEKGELEGTISDEQDSDQFHDSMADALWNIRKDLAAWDPFINSILQPSWKAATASGRRNTTVEFTAKDKKLVPEKPSSPESRRFSAPVGTPATQAANCGRESADSSMSVPSISSITPGLTSPFRSAPMHVPFGAMASAASITSSAKSMLS